MGGGNILFDWGDTLMRDQPGALGPMCDWPEVSALPGAVDLLSQLGRMGVRCHLASGAKDSTEVQIRRALARVGLAPYLERIFCFESIGLVKGRGDFYSRCAALLDQPPSALLMIGNGLETDVLAAGEAGMETIWLNPAGSVAPLGVAQVGALDQLMASSVLRRWLASRALR